MFCMACRGTAFGWRWWCGSPGERNECDGATGGTTGGATGGRYLVTELTEKGHAVEHEPYDVHGAPVTEGWPDHVDLPHVYGGAGGMLGAVQLDGLVQHRACWRRPTKGDDNHTPKRPWRYATATLPLNAVRWAGGPVARILCTRFERVNLKRIATAAGTFHGFNDASHQSARPAEMMTLSTLLTAMLCASAGASASTTTTVRTGIATPSWLRVGRGGIDGFDGEEGPPVVRRMLQLSPCRPSSLRRAATAAAAVTTTTTTTTTTTARSTPKLCLVLST